MNRAARRQREQELRRNPNDDHATLVRKGGRTFVYGRASGLGAELMKGLYLRVGRDFFAGHQAAQDGAMELLPRVDL